mmetsp:Transcript_3141/g.4849  ORF Transcript_3141/g.4849 Transcript_3141/m.4849 type:complete len:90 (+) Transcript_3141:34-303(+)
MKKCLLYCFKIYKKEKPQKEGPDTETGFVDQFEVIRKIISNPKNSGNSKKPNKVKTENSTFIEEIPVYSYENGQYKDVGVTRKVTYVEP